MNHESGAASMKLTTMTMGSRYFHCSEGAKTITTTALAPKRRASIIP